MKYLTTLFIGTAVLAASACTRVTVTEPIGETPVLLESEDWEGLWSVIEDGDTGFLLIEVVDAANGELRVRNVATDPDSDTTTVFLREGGGWTFASARDADDSDDIFEWARVDRDNQRILYWEPVTSRFAELVREGLLPGTVQERELQRPPGSTGEPVTELRGVTLSGLQPEHIDLITSGDQGVLFDWDDPVIMIRMSDSVD